MKTAFIVTTDCDELDINAVFDSKEKAEKYIKLFNNGKIMEITEFALNPYKEETEKNYKLYTIFMEKNGDVISTSKTNSFIDTYRKLPFFEFSSGKAKYDKKILHGCCFAKDTIHAIEITNEKRLELINNEKTL